MIHTSFDTLTDDELVLCVYNDEDASPREVELSLRIERLQDEIEDLKSEMTEGESKKVGAPA